MTTTIEVALIIALGLAAAVIVFLILRHQSLREEADRLRAARREMESSILREDEMRRKQLLESVFQALADGCLLVDEDLEVLFGNDRLREIFDVPPLVVGKRLQEVVSDHRVSDLARRGFQENREQQEAFEISAAGKRRFLVVNVAPVKISGEREARHQRILIRDITEQRETEQIRKDFVANASHELRTPLSIINGYIENFLDGMIDDAALARRSLLTMQKHGERIARIVEDMLTISKFESIGAAESKSLRESAFDCRECVQDVLDRLAPVIEEKKTETVVSIPHDDRMVAGDRFYWDQIFFNLIENAIKENGPGLTVQITLTRLEDGRTRIIVSDNGVGIPRADIPFVFKRFYRVAKHHSKEVKGTGLGLSIVKRAVEAHGGVIHLTSAPGVETAFEILLPERRAGELES